MHGITTPCIVITHLFGGRFPHLHRCANIEYEASQRPLITGQLSGQMLRGKEIKR
jgi:hypothetical protein